MHKLVNTLIIIEISFQYLFLYHVYIFKNAGWCYACKLKAQKGEPGFCGGEKAVEGDFNSRHTKPEHDWGWCDRDCMYSRKGINPSSQQALFVAVNIISQHRCVSVTLITKTQCYVDNLVLNICHNY